MVRPPTSCAGGAGLVFNFQVAGVFRVPQSLGIDVDPNSGALYVCYSMKDPADADEINIYVRKGVPDEMGGYTWEDRVEASALTPTPCDSGIHLDQFFPALYVDDRGWVHLLWQEACDIGDATEPEVYTVYAYSTDGGDTYTRNRLNQDDPLLKTFGGNFIGDYIGIAGAGDKVYALYPSGTEITIKDFDIASSRIDIGVNKADLDGSGAVDLIDHTTFCNCSTDVGINAAAGCFFANLDTDCDVDCDDWCLFQSDCLMGPGPCGACCPTPDCCGDFDGDEDIDLLDFATFLQCFGTSGQCDNTNCSAVEFSCADLTGDCTVDLVDFTTLSVRFGTQPPWVGCPVPLDCGGGAAAAQGGGPQPDYGALAQWTIANVPAAGRQVLANRVRQMAAQTSDATERDVLVAFADAIEP